MARRSGLLIRTFLVGLGALGCALAFSGGHLPSAQAIATVRAELHAPDLIGHFLPPTASGEIRLKIKEDRYHPLFVEVRDLPVECADGSTYPLSFLVKGDLLKDGTFRIERYFGPVFGGPDEQSHIEVHGTLKSPHRAKGTFYYSRISYDDRYPSCSTRPYLPLEWRAHRPH
jgi:hypothetical protein